MHIHILQNGENLFSVSSKYKISTSRLIEENQLSRPYETVCGQSILYTRPNRVYTVKGGDSITALCETQKLSPRTLKQSNPSIAKNNSLFPGQTVVTSPEQPTFGALCVCGYLPAGASLETDAVLPYLTTLTVDGCSITEGALTLPKHMNSTLKSDSTMPALLAGVEADDILSLFKTHTIPDKEWVNRIKAEGLSGIDVGFSSAPTAIAFEKLTALHELLCRCGCSLWIHISSNRYYESPETWHKLAGAADALLLRNLQPKTSFAHQVDCLFQTKDEQSTFSLFPSLPICGYETTVSANGEKTEQRLALSSALIPAHRLHIPIERDKKTDLAFYDYKSGVGRHSKHHRVYMEDAFSFSLGILEMNRQGVLGVCADITSVPLSFLLMLSTKWHLIDGNTCR